jgi:hypothetical protein
MGRFYYQPAVSAAASAASLPGRSDLHFVATNLFARDFIMVPPLLWLISHDADEVRSKFLDRTSDTESGTIPVRVAPPGRSALTVTPVPCSSCDQTFRFKRL